MYLFQKPEKHSQRSLTARNVPMRRNEYLKTMTDNY